MEPSETKTTAPEVSTETSAPASMPESTPSVMPATKSKKPLMVIIAIVILIILGFVAYAATKDAGSNAQPGQNTDANAITTPEQFIVKKGNEVDPALQQTIIAAFMKQKALFASGNLAEIRKYIIQGAPAEAKETIAKQVNAASDESVKNLVVMINKVMKLVTPEVLKDAETTWAFNKDMNAVHIRRAVPAGNPDGIQEIAIDLVYENGQWY